MNNISQKKSYLQCRWQVIRNRSRSHFWRSNLLVGVVIACLARSPQARSTCEEGCDTVPGNTFLGDNALLNNTTGSENTALGSLTLTTNMTGNFNTGCGWEVLGSNVSGGSNSAFGAGSLGFNISGSNNTAVGVYALEQSDADNNTAVGYHALTLNISGTNNTAEGYEALSNNTFGSNNVANGDNALLNSDGSFNAASGVGALKANTSGNSNTANGHRALFNNRTGSNNIAIGASAGFNLTTGDNNIDIGGAGVAGEANTIRLGKNGVQANTYIIGISGVTVAAGVDVIIDNNGHLGTIVSSKRFKDNIQPMDKASESILALRPVTFRYKKELDPQAIPQFGLVAEQVEKVNPDLVARDDQNKPYSVRYEAVNAMLLNEFLKEHRKVESLEQAIAEQRKQMKALTTSLQKVSDQLEVSKPAQILMANNVGKN